MYAAAGGASLASRQKRKNQAAQNVKNKALLQQGLKDKLAASRASGLATPTKAQSRQFHNLPASYLRTPHQQVRKLSAGGYTNNAQTSSSRLLLPITETNPNIDANQHHNYLIHQQQNQQLHHPTVQQQIHQQQLFQQQLQQQQHPHSHPHSHPHHSHHSHHHHHHHHHNHQHQHQLQHHQQQQQQQHQHFLHSHHSHSNTHPSCLSKKHDDDQQLPKSSTLPIVSHHSQNEHTPLKTTTTTTAATSPTTSLLSTAKTTELTPTQPIKLLTTATTAAATTTTATTTIKTSTTAIDNDDDDDSALIALAAAVKINDQQYHQQYSTGIHIEVPTHDSIIVTPATPLVSPGRTPDKHAQPTQSQLQSQSQQQLQQQQQKPHSVATSPVTSTFDRKCSFYRGKKFNTFDQAIPSSVSNNGKLISPQSCCNEEDLIECNCSCQYADEYHTAYNLPNGGFCCTGVDGGSIIVGGGGSGSGGKCVDSSAAGGADSKWMMDQTNYCDSEHQQFGVCSCDHIECAQGRAAWLERGRRCSVQENSTSCHRRWVKRNRIHDSSLGGSSDDDDFLGVLRGPSSFANAFLYVGLGTVAIGLVIAFVGTGEKGFKTTELRLIGPSLIGIGLICCILRILFCICPSQCMSSSSRQKLKKKNAKIDADHTTSLLRGDNKRISIAQNQKNREHRTHDVNEGMEALRQIATTTLFLQNEQQTSTQNSLPVIKEPDKSQDASTYEMHRLNKKSTQICSISDDNDDHDNNINDNNNDNDVILHQNIHSKIAVSIANTTTTITAPAAAAATTGQSSVINIEEIDDEIDAESHEVMLRNGITEIPGIIPSPSITTAATAHEHRPNKLLRTRAPVNQPKPKDSDTLLMETSLIILNQLPLMPAVHLANQEQQQQQQLLLKQQEEQEQMKKHYQQIQEHQLLVQQLSHHNKDQPIMVNATVAVPTTPKSTSSHYHHQYPQQQQQHNQQSTSINIPTSPPPQPPPTLSSSSSSFNPNYSSPSSSSGATIITIPAAPTPSDHQKLSNTTSSTFNLHYHHPQHSQQYPHLHQQSQQQQQPQLYSQPSSKSSIPKIITNQPTLINTLPTAASSSYTTNIGGILPNPITTTSTTTTIMEPEIVLSPAKLGQ